MVCTSVIECQGCVYDSRIYRTPTSIYVDYKLYHLYKMKLHFEDTEVYIFYTLLPATYSVFL